MALQGLRQPSLVRGAGLGILAESLAGARCA
jgi:hypothetical protein